MKGVDDTMNTAEYSGNDPIIIQQVNNSGVRTGSVRDAVESYGDMLFKLCLIMLRNHADAEDAVQETFIKYMQKAPNFTDSEHEKAWLLKVAANKCRDLIRYRSRHFTEPEEVLGNIPALDREDSHILEALMELPEKFRLALTLHYVEEYKVEEIAQLIGKSPSAVKMRLSKGRKLLEEKYRKEYL